MQLQLIRLPALPARPAALPLYCRTAAALLPHRCRTAAGHRTPAPPSPPPEQGIRHAGHVGLTSGSPLLIPSRQHVFAAPGDDVITRLMITLHHRLAATPICRQRLDISI
ncbi:hypothetical protein B5X24_HaOG215519 [Helicoverpa armigera]|nr:hypothetical protein B5X24_HaOG215519 [Helicoverpa armigera]